MHQIIVPCYGIHRTPVGVAYLQQGRGGTNALGLREKSPFTVRLPNRRVHCNHQIPLSTPIPNDYHWGLFMRLVRDPLAWAMLPLPKKDLGAYYLASEDDRFTLPLIALSRMSSPIYPCIVPIWTIKKTRILEELQQTNVQPLVITGLEPKHSAMVAEIAAAAALAPRTLVLVGRSDVIVPSSVTRIETDILNHSLEEITGMPWENLGATVIRKAMRDEWLNNPEDGSYVEPKSLSTRGPGS